MDRAAEGVVRYFEDIERPRKSFRAPSAKERSALLELVRRLESWDGATDPESLQVIVYAVGRDLQFEPLREWFKAIYEVLLGASQGPRFGGFIAAYGISETCDLIRSRVDDEAS